MGWEGSNVPWAHPRSDWHSFSSPLCPAQPKWEWANIVARQTRRPSSAAVRTRRIGTALRDQSVASAARRAASATSGRVDSNIRAVQREGFDSQSTKMTTGSQHLLARSKYVVGPTWRSSNTDDICRLFRILDVCLRLTGMQATTQTLKIQVSAFRKFKLLEVRGFKLGT